VTAIILAAAIEVTMGPENLDVVVVIAVWYYFYYYYY